MRLTKALYGYMQSAIIWYETFKGCLEGMGFKINHYNPCVANKVIGGNQCTIVWYVDNNTISNMNPNLVDNVIQKIEDKFGKMTVTRGKDHVFVGIYMKFLDNGKVRILMKEYITEDIDVIKSF